MVLIKIFVAIIFTKLQRFESGAVATRSIVYLSPNFIVATCTFMTVSLRILGSYRHHHTHRVAFVSQHISVCIVPSSINTTSWSRIAYIPHMQKNSTYACHIDAPSATVTEIWFLSDSPLLNGWRCYSGERLMTENIGGNKPCRFPHSATRLS